MTESAFCHRRQVGSCHPRPLAADLIAIHGLRPGVQTRAEAVFRCRYVDLISGFVSSTAFGHRLAIHGLRPGIQTTAEAACCCGSSWLGTLAPVCMWFYQQAYSSAPTAMHDALAKQTHVRTSIYDHTDTHVHVLMCN